MSKEKQSIYKVRFLADGQIYEIYAKEVNQSNLFGFLEVSGMCFGEHTTVVVDPSEERLKNEFNGVTCSYIPMHAILRIDVVEKEGTAKVTEWASKSDNVAHFPSPIYTPSPEKT